ncbi:MAG: hypothetical protein R3232_09785, partial [Clostridia bacterium]|nr:hypothetical protein [Clostridia bacterium]
MRTGLLREDFKYTGTNEDSLFTGKTMALKCVRNSYAAFQFILETDEPCTVCMTEEPAFTIYPERQVYRIAASAGDLGTICVQNVSLLPDDNGILRADIIENRDYIHIEAGKPVVFWCEVPVGKDTEPGSYLGSIRIFSRKLFGSEKVVAENTFTVEVADITLPDPKEYKMQLDLWQHLSNIARKH